LAFGVRVQADTATSAVFGSNESAEAALMLWHFRVDSAGTPVTAVRTLAPQFDSYVFTPTAAPIDSSLVVGGMPSARSLVRINLPAHIKDSTQIVRATLILVPTGPAVGAAVDSFTLIAHGVLADLGAKSPLLTPSTATDSTYFGAVPFLPGSTDTVFLEVTRLLRRWSADTGSVSTLVLRSGSEGLVLTEARFYSSRTAAFKPSLRVTYVPSFPFGVP
jgi:hypothetical protein